MSFGLIWVFFPDFQIKPRRQDHKIAFPETECCYNEETLHWDLVFLPKYFVLLERLRNTSSCHRTLYQKLTQNIKPTVSPSCTTTVHTQHYHSVQPCTVLSSWIVCWSWPVSMHFSMPQYFSQTCLEPLKAEQTKESRQIVTKTVKVIFKLKRNSKMGLQIHSWAQVCSLI